MEYTSGDRVELVHTTDPHTFLKPGDRGTVTSHNERFNQLEVHWDSGSRLAMIYSEGDRVRRV